MTLWDARCARYQRDDVTVQMGGLASNLSRIAWFAQRADRAGALPIFQESKYFTEWAAPACSLEQQSLLAELQWRLAMWERSWGSKMAPSQIAQEASAWSAQLLEQAGCLARW